MIVLILGLLAAVSAGTSTDNKETYKNQHCTDPRTMKKHPAYTEWADAYSCTRHRCQPGGRNLAIYTVGCKRVEAPESAIECEEVVEDTNMQFPFCCTRLRCLVVVRGEVWTRVLGQPWEVLPAAPWSHMYKMKKPPPEDSNFLPKTADQGPVYELSESDTEQSNHDKVLRTGKKANANAEYNDGDQQPVARAALPSPDIVIALSTNDAKESTHPNTRRKHRKANSQPPESYFEEDVEKEKHAEPKPQAVEEVPTYNTEKPQEVVEDESTNYNYYAVTEKTSHKPHNTHNPVSWTEIPQNQWNSEPKEAAEMENQINELNSNHNYHAQVPQPEETPPQVMQETKPALHIPLRKDTGDKPSNLQALVDAIGSRMRDIENVVQKMSDKVHQVKPLADGSIEKRMSSEREGSHKHHKETKRPSAEDENYKSDASNSILRRNNPPKEPPPTYMAPVETRRKMSQVHIAVPSPGEEADKRRKKHAHKKRKAKGTRSHKKHSHSKDDKRKHFNRLSSGEAEKNAVSLDDSSEAMS
ncbi:hypothetical protein PYW08_011094 [Mythimna loreyi]|uniref:Uncharacterized protein n=1 Tax=Mythimna loreyi TaxID=667449 RepID=A0ACC2Q5Y3_9NEOP|nr:hypothetical protein PYW08_011094 [Mythimna loreyi]